jgi:hypothetical protein
MGTSHAAPMESDNKGTRHDSLGKAISYWMVERKQTGVEPPFVMYEFSSADAAREALLTLPCIETAGDTHALICTEPLIFGFYQTDPEHWDAVLCGEGLCVALWRAAHEAFEQHGGRKKNDKKPDGRQSYKAESRFAGQLRQHGLSRADLGAVLRTGGHSGGGQPETRWRFDDSGRYQAHPDISGATFDDITFIDTLFDGAGMRDMAFTRCGFLRCSFKSAQLNRSCFREALFQKCSFAGADLTGTDFVDCTFTDTHVPGRESASPELPRPATPPEPHRVAARPFRPRRWWAFWG